MNCRLSIDQMEIQHNFRLLTIEIQRIDMHIAIFLSRYELAFKYYLLGQLTLLQLSVTTLIKQHFDFEDIFAENT